MATPQLRFKEFDEDWFASKIDEIASVTSGGTPSRANSQYWEGDIPWVTTSLVDFNVIHSAEEFITEEGVNNSSAKLFPKDTILMAMYGQGITRGKVAILGIEATTNQACCAIKLKNSFDIRFVFQNLMNRYDEIRDLSNDGGQKNLSSGIIKDIIVTYPSKQEQTKIASFLSVVDEKISQLTQKHELLSQYKQGMMQKLFSQQIRFKADDGSEFGEWEYTTLGEVVDFSNGKRIPLSEGERQKRQGNYRYYGASGVIDYVDDYIFDGQYILIGEDGANILTRSLPLAFVVEGKFWVNNHAHIFQSKKGNNLFLATYLESLNYEKFNSGTAQPKLNMENLKKVPVIDPCLEEQTKIAHFLSAIDQKIEVVAQQIEQAKQWKKGLLQQMFV